MKFGKGSKLFYRDGTPVWEKTNDNDWGYWVCLNSTYLVEKKVYGPNESKYESRPQSELPIEKRYSFQWSDAQVAEHMGKYMNFEVK